MGNEESFFQDEKVLCNEELFRIEGKQLHTLLHRSIGAIKCLNNNTQVVAGSAFLLSKNIVLTSAHNVYDRALKSDNKSIRIYFGANGTANKYYEVEGIRYMQQFKTCLSNEKIEFDFALLKLTKQVPFDQFLRLSLPCKTCLINKNQQICLQIFGFPGNYRQNYKFIDKYGKEIILYQYGLAVNSRIRVVNPSKHMIGYGISTLPGQSGCPVVIGKSVIAIHNGGGGKGNQQFNIGRLIDYPLLNKLKEWCKQLNGHPFNIQDKNLCSHVQQIMKDYLLQKLDLSNSQLSTIDVTKYINLSELSLRDNQLSTIDLTKNIELTKVSLGFNKLTSIDVTKNTKLTKLYLQNNQISAIDVTKNISLVELYLRNSQLSTIDVTKNTYLLELSLINSKIYAIDLTKNIHLTYLSLANNQLSTINVTKNINLIQLALFNNHLSSIDVTQNTSLIQLSLYKNNLSAIDLTKNIKLTKLDLYNNQLSSIDVTQNISLNKLDLYNNKFSAIDVTKNINLNKLYIHNNQLLTINVTKNINLNKLYLHNNHLSSIDVTKNINLAVLSLFSNQLTAIDVSKNIGLTVLSLGSNKLTEIDITKNIDLTLLSLKDNELSAINVTKNGKLEYLFLESNKINKINVWLSAQKPIHHLFQFDFSNQLSNICEIQIEYSSEDDTKCNVLKKGWAQKYQEEGDSEYNKHKCKYVLTAVKR